MTLRAIKIFFTRKLASALVSLLIVTVLTLQAAVSFCPGTYSSLCSSLKWISSPPQLWPFINYPMYSSAHYEGEAIPRFFVFGTLEDSTEVPILPADLDMSNWQFRREFVAGLSTDSYEKVKASVALYQNRNNRRLAGLRLENHPLVLSREGVRPGPPQVRKNLRFGSLAEE